eukprot:gene18210-25617_t
MSIALFSAVALVLPIALISINVRFGQNIASTIQEHRSLRSAVHEEIRHKFIILPINRPQSIVGEIIEFDLFDEDIVFGVVSHVFRRSDYSFGWYGMVSSVDHGTAAKSYNDDGYFELSCEHEACTASLSIYSTSKTYRIDSAGYSLNDKGGGIYKLSETYLAPERRTGIYSNTTLDVFQADIFRQSNLNHNLRTSFLNKDVAAVVGVDTDLILDILVIYTPQALAGVGSLVTLKSMINLANDGANVILSNSA